MNNATQYLYISEGSFLFIGKSMDTVVHEHHLFQIVIAFEKEFKLYIENKLINAQALLIDKDVPHKFESKDGLHMILLIDPDKDVAKKMKRNMNNTSYQKLDFSLFNKIVDNILGFYPKDFEVQKIKEIINEILRIILNANIVNITKDLRIRQLLNYIKTLENKNVSVKELAKKVSLSESRLIHLFTKEIGIPLRKYLLWSKLIDAINYIVRGMDFTEACYAAGFSDSAHLSRTFKKMFGITLLILFKNYDSSRFVQVIIE